MLTVNGKITLHIGFHLGPGPGQGGPGTQANNAKVGGEHLGVGAPGGWPGILYPNTASPVQPGGQIRRGGKGTTFVDSYSGSSFGLRLETGSWQDSFLLFFFFIGV